MDRPQNILITGAAGYIGGSILSDFVSGTNGSIAGARIHAVVRSEQQVHTLSKLGVNILNFELSDEAAVAAAIDKNESNSMDYLLVSNLLQALGRRKAVVNTPVYLIHSSVTTWYSEEGGWPHGNLKDTDAIYEKEKELDIPHPIRETNVFLVKKAKECGVTSFNLAIPNIYGVGTGEGRKISILIPALIQASIALKKVHKFDKDGYPPAAHISDVVALYRLVVEHVLQEQKIPNGKDGYYFVQAHRAPWWAYMEALAKSLYARGLVADSEVETWPSDEAAAQALHFPAQFIRAMGTASGGLEPVNAYRLGWQPKWDEQMFLDHADDEVQALLDLGKVRTSLFDKIMTSATN
ncbi:NAD(P)-binding protein [Lophiostoma macrostomum CBS 122681]|uniref:NAD(P)-binding protein n=1 Tax=Lophiostoma macrostomum CBS 122681 TaxID=1314788 RepID=A0A6A6SYK3_9PLEO|nr:NAD(P)-binding protein [Lophiostoma macrostomum CBS 122681]